MRIADRLYRHPGGTLPTKRHDPKDDTALDRLMNRPEGTHTAVLAAHRQQTLERMRQTHGLLLVRHDTTQLDYSGWRSITDRGPSGGGLNRGFWCHNSLAFDPERRAVIGLVSQLLHRRRPVGRQEGVKAKRERTDRESLLGTAGLEAVGPAAAAARWVPVADRGVDAFELLARPVAAGHRFVVPSNRSRVIRQGHDPQGPKNDLHA